MVSQDQKIFGNFFNPDWLAGASHSTAPINPGTKITCMIIPDPKHEAESSIEQASNRHPAPKWEATVNDEPIPLPQQIVGVAVIKEQAAVPADHTLIRDHNSPNDVVLKDDDIVDLARGNV